MSSDYQIARKKLFYPDNYPHQVLFEQLVIRIADRNPNHNTQNLRFCEILV